MTSPAYSKKKEPEKVRQALIDAAAALVVERGLANVTVSAVAAGAQEKFLLFIQIPRGGIPHFPPAKLRNH